MPVGVQGRRDVPLDRPLHLDGCEDHAGHGRGLRLPSAGLLGYTTRGTWPTEHFNLLHTAITCRASSQLHVRVQQTFGGYATVHAWTVPSADSWSGCG